MKPLATIPSNIMQTRLCINKYLHAYALYTAIVLTIASASQGQSPTSIAGRGPSSQNEPADILSWLGDTKLQSSEHLKTYWEISALDLHTRHAVLLEVVKNGEEDMAADAARRLIHDHVLEVIETLKNHLP